MRRRRRAPAEDGAPARLGRLERALLTFMGPPEVGDASAPAPVLPARPVETCPRCGRPRDDHEVVRDPRLTWTRCPADPEPSTLSRR